MNRNIQNLISMTMRLEQRMGSRPFPIFSTHKEAKEYLARRKSIRKKLPSELLEAVRQAIADEDSRDPLTDRLVTILLNEQGLAVSRQDVTNARDCLGYYPASLRRIYED